MCDVQVGSNWGGHQVKLTSLSPASASNISPTQSVCERDRDIGRERERDTAYNITSKLSVEKDKVSLLDASRDEVVM